MPVKARGHRAFCSPLPMNAFAETPREQARLQSLAFVFRQAFNRGFDFSNGAHAGIPALAPRAWQFPRRQHSKIIFSIGSGCVSEPERRSEQRWGRPESVPESVPLF